MPFQLVKTRAFLQTLLQFRRLPPIAQEQYLATAETREPRATGIEPLTHAAHCLALPWCTGEAYCVVDRDTPDVPLYDVWFVDDQANGLVFVADTNTRAGVVVEWSEEFAVARGNEDCDGAAVRLASALNDAERIEPDSASLLFERHVPYERWLVGFVSPNDVPTSRDDWDALFADHGYPKVSDEFIERYGEGFGPETWRHSWRSEKRSDAVIRRFARTPQDWEAVSGSLSEEVIRENIDKVHWESICRGLSEAFIREFHDRLRWDYLIRHSRLSEALMREFQDRVDWSAASWFQSLSEPFIEEFVDRISFVQLSRSEDARSIAFLRAHEAQLNWGYLSGAAPNLDELIEAFPERIQWGAVSERALATEFITRHVERLDWTDRMMMVTEEQARLFKDRVDWVKLACARWEPWVEQALRAHEYLVHGERWVTILQEGRVSLLYKNEIRARRARKRVLEG